MKTFFTWMMKNHKGEDTPAGDLAYDMERDKENFPRNREGKLEAWNAMIRAYLEFMGACDAAIDTFNKCWKEYELSTYYAKTKGG